MNFLGSLFGRKPAANSANSGESTESPVRGEDVFEQVHPALHQRLDYPDVDFGFSEDDIGCRLLELFDEFLALEQSGASAEEVQAAFGAFAFVFGVAYEPVVRAQCSTNESQEETPVRTRPPTVWKTLGHPCELVVQAARMLLEFMEVQCDSKSRSVTLDSLPEGDGVSLALKRVFRVEGEETGTDESVLQRSRARSQFLRILRCLSLVVYWPHNRALIAHKLGFEFLKLMADLMRVLVLKIEELGFLWSEGLAQQMIRSDKELQDETSFVFSAILSLVQFVSFSTICLPRVRTFLCTGYLPAQPWTAADCSSMGFDWYDGLAYVWSNEKASSHSGRWEKKHWSSHFPDKDHAATVLEERAHVEAMHSIFMLSTKDSNFEGPVTSSVQSFLGEFAETLQQDEWSGDLIRAGFFRALLSFFRKSLLLLQNLQSRTSVVSEGSTKNDTINFLTPGSSIDVHNAYVSGSILQNEALFAMFCLACAQPAAARTKMHLCDGHSVLASILSSRNSGSDYAESYSCNTDGRRMLEYLERFTQFERAFMCLRLTELVLVVPGERDELRTAGIDCQITFEQLGGLLQWMVQKLNHPQGFQPQYMRIELNNPHECKGPRPIHDLWPWDDRISAENAAKTLRGAMELSPLCFHLCQFIYQHTDEDVVLDSPSRKYVRMMDSGTTPLRCLASMMDQSIGADQQIMRWSWHSCGSTGRAWALIFDSLFRLCSMHRAIMRDARRANTAHEWDLLRQILFVIGQHFFGSEGIEVPEGLRPSNLNRQRTNSSETSRKLPFLQYHTVVLLAKCLRIGPTEMVSVCRKMKVWDLLLSSHFLRGGSAAVDWLSSSAVSDRVRAASSSELTRHKSKDSLESIDSSDSLDGMEREGRMKTINGPKRKLQWCPSDPVHPNDALAYGWMALRDGVLDLMMIVVEAAITPPTSQFIRGPQPEVMQIIDLLRDQTPDTVVFQVSYWLALLSQERRRTEALSPILQQHTVSNAMVLCRTHLHDLGLTTFNLSSSAIHQLSLVEKNRIFLWPTRAALLSLVLLLTQGSAKEACIHLFLVPIARNRVVESGDLKLQGSWRGDASHTEDIPVVDDVSPPASTFQKMFYKRENFILSGKADVSLVDDAPVTAAAGAEHATLFFLFLDPRCRHAALYLLTELMHICALRRWQESHAVAGSPEIDEFGTTTLRRNVSVGLDKLETTSECRLISFDIVSSLLDHLSISMKLPSWCDGFHGAMAILRWICCLLRDPKQTHLQVFHQSIFRKARFFPELQAFMITATLKYRRVTSTSSGKPRTHDRTRALTPNTLPPIQEAESPVPDEAGDVETEDNVGTRLAAKSHPEAPMEGVLEEKSSSIATETDPSLDISLAEDQANEDFVDETDQEDAGKKSRQTGYIPVWPRADKAHLVRQVLTTFTALMYDNDISKAEFRAMVQSRKRAKSRLSGKAAKSSYMPYHDLKRVVLHVDATPSLETHLVLFNMIVHAEYLLPSKHIAQALFAGESLLDDRKKTRVPKIHSTDIVPLIFYLLPHSCSELQQSILKTFTKLTGWQGNQSLLNFMQPPLVDLVLDLTPSVSEETLPAVMDLLKGTGTHSISVAQLKRIFRLMHSKGEHRPVYSWRLLDTLREMIIEEEHAEGPRACFLFEGVDSGLRLPFMPRWPVGRGFTFCTWIRVERNSGRIYGILADSGSPTNVDSPIDPGSPAIDYLGSSNGIDKVHTETEERYKPFVFTLRNDVGIGIDVFLNADSEYSKFVLCASSHKSDKQSSTVCMRSDPLHVEVWNFIAVSHLYATFRTRSEITLTVNDKHYMETFNCPRFQGAIQHCYVGDSAPKFRHPRHNTTLAGQMGAVYFFDEPLNDQQLDGVFKLGPSYTYSFESPTIDRRDVLRGLPTEDQAKISAALDGVLTQHIMLAYNPRVWRGDAFLDNTPEKNSVRWKPTSLLPQDDGVAADHDAELSLDQSLVTVSTEACSVAGHMHAKRLPGTLDYLFRDVKDALDSLGGIKVLFPLFAQFDQPALLEDGSKDYSVDERLNVKVLDLLCTLLRDSSENHRLLRNYSGFTLVGYFLERVSPLHMSQEAFQSMISLVDRVSWKPEFQDSAVMSLIANFKLWVFASVPVHTQVLLYLKNLCRDANYGAARLRVNLSVQKLLDALDLLYWYESPKLYRAEVEYHNQRNVEGGPNNVRSDLSSTSRTGSLFTASRWLHPTSGHVVAVKPTGKELKELRRHLFDILELTLQASPGVLPEDIHLLIGFLVQTPDAISKVETLQLLQRLLCNENCHTRVLLGLSTCSGTQMILDMCAHVRPKVRIQALVVLCEVLHVAVQWKVLPPLPAESRLLDFIESKRSHLPHLVLSPDDDKEEFMSSRRGLRKIQLAYSNRVLSRSSDSDSLADSQNTVHATVMESSDTWEALRLPIGKLQFILTYAAVQFTEAVKQDFLSQDSTDAQMKITIEVFERILLAQSADYLVDTIDCLYPDFKERSTTPLGRSSHVMDPLQIPARSRSRAESEESLICIPMAFPALLRLLSDDSCSPKLRLSALVDLKTLLSNPHNCESILRLPVWQDPILALFASSQARLSAWRSSKLQSETYVNNNTNVHARVPSEKSDQKEGALLDTCMRMICDIQLHALRLGAPPVSPCVLTKEEARAALDSALSAPLAKMQDIRSGKRRIGVSIIRETVSYLRCYGEDGEISCYITGLNLLQQTLDILNRECDAHRAKSPSTSLESLRILHLNMWLIAAVILEFLAMPEMRMHRSRKANNLPTLPAGTPVPEPSPVPPSRRSRTPPHSSTPLDDDFNLHNLYRRNSDSVLLKSTASKGMDTAFLPSSPKGFRASSFDVEGMEPDAFYPRTSDSYAVLGAKQLGSSWRLANELASLAPLSLEVTSTFRSSSLPPIMSTGESAPATPKTLGPYHMTQERFSDTWRLVDSLVGLLGPLADAPSWLSSELKFAKHSRTATLDESVDRGASEVLKSRSRTPASKPMTPNASMHKQHESPLTQVAGNIPWIIVRVLVTVFTKGGMLDDEDNIDSLSIPIQALQRLTVLLTSLHEREYEHYDFEVLYVMAMVVDALTNTTLTTTSTWVRGAVQLLLRLLRNHCDQVAELLEMQNEQASVTPVEINRSVSGTLTTFIERIFSGRKSSSGLADEDQDIATPNVRLRAPSTDAQIKELFLQDVTTEYLTLQTIRGVLGEPYRNITLDDWNAALLPIVTEAKKMEADALTSRLTELGLHKQSLELGQQLELHREEQLRLTEALLSYSITAKEQVLKFEMIHKWEVVRAYESQRRRCGARWGRILTELANERGAWGCGADEDDTHTFWILDSLEDNSRRRLRLVRNPSGSVHHMASMLTRGDAQKNKKTEKVIPLADLAAESSTSDEVLITHDTSAHALWKDLLKYQRKVSKKPTLELEDIKERENDVIPTADVDRGEDEEKENALAMSMVDDGRDVLGTGTSSREQRSARGERERLKLLFEAECEVIHPFVSCKGTIRITKQGVSFIRSEGESFQQPLQGEEWMWVLQPMGSTTIPLSEIRDSLLRYYQLRFVAVEIFFLAARTSMFINLFNQKDAKTFDYVLRNQARPPNILPYLGKSPKTIISRATAPNSSYLLLTQAWVQREISNFNYLMALNTIAGRTFNDLSQYPVFPWVIANYTSRKIDLRDPNVFRDLRWPMGAQKESQRQLFIERYQQLAVQYEEALVAPEDPFGGPAELLPPFHYGSHYSNAAYVLWYMLRMEPYTSLHIHLQDGKFDKPDRLFHSLAAAYNGVTSNGSDVKELIPELFFLPECLLNINDFDLGKTQNDVVLSDVVVPVWAKDVFDFVYTNREALESEYVSRNLHHWIDLIFGYKQRPPLSGGDQACVDACNVFFHLTYEGAVNLDELRYQDPLLYESTMKQIDNFGQTPAQLFDKPHPQRLAINQVDIIWPLASIVNGAHTIPKGEPQPEKPTRIITFDVKRVSHTAILLIAEMSSSERLVTVDINRVVGYHTWQVMSPDVVPPFRFKVDSAALELSQGPSSIGSYGRLGHSATISTKRVGVPFAPQGFASRFHYTSQMVLESETQRTAEPDLENHRTSTKMRFSTRAKSSVTSRPEPKTSRRQLTSKLGSGDDDLTSRLVAVHEDWKLLFSCGHWDQSFKVTAVDTGKLLQSVAHHRDVVTCLTLAQDKRRHWLVTASRDCTVMVWEIREHKDAPVPPAPIHVLYGHDDTVGCVAVCSELDLVASGSEDGTIILHSLREGQYIRSITSRRRSESRQRAETSEATSLTKPRIHWVGLSKNGWVCSYSHDDTSVCTHSINGRLLARKDTNERIFAFTFSDDGNVLITGGEMGKIFLRWVRSLEFADDNERSGFQAVLDGSMDDEGGLDPFSCSIKALCLTRQERHLIVGLSTGEVRVLAHDSDYLMQRLQNKLVEIGIL